MLQAYGYAAAWSGKNPNAPDWESRMAEPFDRWPQGLVVAFLGTKINLRFLNSGAETLSV
jgi:hypothetical protein